MNIPNNLRVGSKPTKELIDEGVPANSALVAAGFYFESEQGIECIMYSKEKTKHAVLKNACVGEGFDVITDEPKMQIPVRITHPLNSVCSWMR